MTDFSHYGLATRAVRGGQRRSLESEHNDPIFLTSSYVFEDAAQAARRFSNEEDGNIYSRFSNPTVRAFEERLALLEDGRFCVATGSGMAAILSLAMTVLEAGDHVVVSRSLFGSTINLFSKTLARFGVDVTFVAPDDTSAFAHAVRAQTRLIFIESPSNPLGEIADIEALAGIAHRQGCLLAVDNVACSPALQQPLGLGAHVVVHSATKYIDGQGRCVGGAIVTDDEDLHADLVGFMRTAGPTLSPFNAWVFLNGLETLVPRMQLHSSQAAAVARWLERHPAVERVYYPGLASHPGHELARRQQSGFGGVVAFDVVGGREAAWSVVDATRLVSITANLGDTKSTITHPASTTHARITAAERARMGVGDSLLRLSVGFEEVADITSDLARGLDPVADKLARSNPVVVGAADAAE